MGKDGEYTIETTTEVVVYVGLYPEEIQRLHQVAANQPDNIDMDVLVCNDLEEVQRVLFESYK